mmetsp:Transcript_11494/g.23151  ORF Transcript_11494/g.23151 Transcript_11494/m.23151 type:complete len:236 (+) Transcript_11494:111-818(+)
MGREVPPCLQLYLAWHDSCRIPQWHTKPCCLFIPSFLLFILHGCFSGGEKPSRLVSQSLWTRDVRHVVHVQRVVGSFHPIFELFFFFFFELLDRFLRLLHKHFVVVVEVVVVVFRFFHLDVLVDHHVLHFGQVLDFKLLRLPERVSEPAPPVGAKSARAVAEVGVRTVWAENVVAVALSHLGKVRTRVLRRLEHLDVVVRAVRSRHGGGRRWRGDGHVSGYGGGHRGNGGYGGRH